MNALNTLENVSDSIIEKPVTVEVTIDPQSWYQGKMQCWFPKFFPKKKILQMHPIKLGSLVKISKLLLSIDKDIFDKNNILESNHRAMDKHGKDLAMVIAIAFHNRKTDPPASLVNMILEQFTPKELLQVSIIVLTQMNVSAFMSSIISVRNGLSILESQDANVTSAESNEVSQ